MLLRVYYFLLTSIISGAAFSQEGDYHGWYKRADALFNREDPTPATDSTAAALFLKTYEPAFAAKDGKVALESLIKTATIRQTYGGYADACGLYRRSLALNRAYFHDTARLYYASLYLGTAFYQQGMTDSARHYFEDASRLLASSDSIKEFPEQERLYNSLGAIYFEIANYQQAINYFQKAKQFVNDDNDDSETMITLQSNIANCLLQLNRYEEAIRIFKTLTPRAFIQRALYHNTGHSYYKSGRYDSALYYLAKVKKQDDWITVRTMNDLGRINIIKGNIKEASRSLDTSLAVCYRLAKGNRNQDRALIYLNKAIVADAVQDIHAAVDWCNKAIRELYVTATSYSGDEYPKDETRCLSPITLLQVLKYKSAILEKLYASDSADKYLVDCFNAHRKAIQVASYLRRWLDNDEAKMFFQEDQSGIYHKAMSVAYRLWAKDRNLILPEHVLGVIAEYKGNILYENLRKAMALTNANVPQQVKNEEKSLKESLSYYTVRLGNSGEASEATDLRQKILDVQVKLSRLHKQYEEHDAYEFLNEEPSGNYYRDLMSFIDNRTAIVNYMVTPDTVYGLVISKQGLDMKLIPVNNNLEQAYKTFTSEIYAHEEGKRYTGQRASKLLYDALIAPFGKSLPEKQKWVILPDGFLNYVPFDALTRSNNHRDYLVLHHTISYHYSLPLLMNHRRLTQPASQQLNQLFFAPFAGANAQTATLPALPFSLNEAPGAGMTKYTGAAARKDVFLNEVSNSNVIHLATHAMASTAGAGDGKICFYPSEDSAEKNDLHLNEIYALDLRDVELVVLSACETAGGNNASGEGLLSLSRAFMYAGSKGMVSTLWKTEDRVSVKLMQFFYEARENGAGNEEALRKAKEKFLADKEVSEKYKTPNYWGNFIYVGSIDKKQESFPATSGILILILGCVLTVIVVRCLVKRKSYSAIPE